MTKEELELKRFEFEQKIRLEEIELRKKELELKIQEQKSQRIFTPLLISIVGGLITIMTGLILKYYDNKATLELEDQKSQSSLLLKAADAKTYDEFANMLDAFSSNGFLKMDTSKLRDFKDKRLSSDFKQHQAELYKETTSIISFLTVNSDFNSIRFKEKLERFWELYWVELSSVETPEVESAMVHFGNVLKQLQDNDFKDFNNLQNELQNKGYEVAQAIKKGSIGQ